MNLILRYNQSRKRYVDQGLNFVLTKIQKDMMSQLDIASMNRLRANSDMFPRRSGKTLALIAWAKVMGYSVIIGNINEKQILEKTYSSSILPHIITIGQLPYERGTSYFNNGYVTDETVPENFIRSVVEISGINIVGGWSNSAYNTDFIQRLPLVDSQPSQRLRRIGDFHRTLWEEKTEQLRGTNMNNVSYPAARDHITWSHTHDSSHVH